MCSCFTNPIIVSWILFLKCNIHFKLISSLGQISAENGKVQSLEQGNFGKRGNQLRRTVTSLHMLLTCTKSAPTSWVHPADNLWAPSHLSHQCTMAAALTPQILVADVVPESCMVIQNLPYGQYNRPTCLIVWTQRMEYDWWEPFTMLHTCKIKW